MNTSLSTFMKIGITAVTIGTLVLGLLLSDMISFTNVVNTSIENSMPGGG